MDSVLDAAAQRRSAAIGDPANKSEHFGLSLRHLFGAATELHANANAAIAASFLKFMFTSILLDFV
ncbi:MAG: hypothetical protein WDO18_15595 [Acidobacteriota bacterium]